MRGTTDYWVNAMDGRPFFVVSCAADPGLLSALREQIVPRLKADVPNQPGQEQLEADPHLNRFTICAELTPTESVFPGTDLRLIWGGNEKGQPLTYDIPDARKEDVAAPRTGTELTDGGRPAHELKPAKQPLDG